MECQACPRLITIYDDRVYTDHGEFHAECFAEYLLTLPQHQQYFEKMNSRFQCAHPPLLSKEEIAS